MRSIDSKLHRTASIACIAATVLACAGYVVANSVGDQTPPYEPSPLNELAWSTFLMSSAFAAALGLLLIGWKIRDETRR